MKQSLLQGARVVALVRKDTKKCSKCVKIRCVKMCEDTKRKTHFAYFRTIRHFGVVNHGPKWENCPAKKKKKKVWRVLDYNEFFIFFV